MYTSYHSTYLCETILVRNRKISLMHAIVSKGKDDIELHMINLYLDKHDIADRRGVETCYS